ncbi:MAG: leucine-rich repeat protein [Treponema sp.]|nr:leucine-rich repeat protein [Treponema sp.]
MKQLILLWGCVFALGLFSCKTAVEEVLANDEDVCILVNGSETMTSLEVGQQYILRLSNSSLANWAVSNAVAATLSATSGVSVNLSAKSAGSVTVTATANGKTCTCALQIIKKGSEIEVPPDNGETNAPNVSFTNLSAYKVLVCRDGLSAEITTVEAGDTKTVYVSPGSNEITFHFRYSYCIVDDDDNGTIWVVAADNSAYTYPVDSADIAQGVVQINIPAPKNPQFNAAYLKIENQSTQPVSLYNGNTQQKLYGQEKYYIQPRHSGVYAIPPDAPFEGFSVGASPSFAIAVAPFDVVSGALYACVFSAGGLLTNVSEEIRLGEMWAENTDTNYTVRHFKQDTDRIGYTLTETESLTGIMGADTDAKAMIYTGFTANPFEQVPISADETTVIDIYYDRNEYTVTFYANNGTDDTQSQTFYYGIEEKLKDNMFSNSGYGFLGWATSETDNPVYNNKADFLIGSQDPTNITLYAIWFHGITVTDDTARSIDLSDITDEYTIKVTGNISQSTLQTLADKIKTAKTAINLDLSEATGITEISSIGGSTSSDSKSIFADCRPLNSLALPKTLEVIGSYAFAGCNIKSVVIPAGVQTIGSSAFHWCYNLESIEIDGVETIGNYAFYYCKNLKSVVLKNVTTIGNSTFENCTSLSSITIDAETIGSEAFDGCTSLTAVVIGKNVKSISAYCFKGCSQLTSVRFEDTEGWYCKSSSGYLYQEDVTNAAENASNFRYYNYNLWYKE